MIARNKTLLRMSSTRSYQFFSRMLRYSTFIGGPTCTCTPISPSAGRFGASSSIVDAHQAAVEDVHQRCCRG